MVVSSYDPFGLRDLSLSLLEGSRCLFLAELTQQSLVLSLFGGNFFTGRCFRVVFYSLL